MCLGWQECDDEKWSEKPSTHSDIRTTQNDSDIGGRYRIDMEAEQAEQAEHAYVRGQAWL